MEICLLGLLLWCFQLELLWAAGIFQYQRSSPPKARTPKAKEWMPSSSSSLASAFTWVPTPNLDKADPEGTEAAVAFLYSGNVLRLSQANCTRRFEVRDVGKASGPPLALHSYLRGATDTLTHATNFLNMVFQTNDIRESSVKEDVEWYHALVRSVMEGDSQVYRAVLTFDAHPVSSKPQMMLQATKENNEILLRDLSASAESLRNLTWENEWYNFFRFQRVPVLYKRILSNDLKTLDTPKWSQGDSYVMDTGHVKWSPPFLECEDGKFLPNWMVTLSSSFYGLKPDLNPEFKGVVRIDVKIQNVDINQCANGQGWFANTHQCDLNSTQCIPQESQGFVLGKYLCVCKPGFYGPSRIFSSSYSSGNGQSGESASQYGAMDSGNVQECRRCREGCTTCTDGTPCLIQEDWSLRAAILAFQAFCMLAVFLSMLVSYHFRKSKVFILYFKPSIFRCIVLRWVRMLGFAIVYGTITLKLYRVLKVFLSRTAQRVPYMSSGRVLKMLALILLLVLWFLAAWTVGMLENIEKNIPLVVRSQTTRGLQFYICYHDRWDYMMVVAEMLFLLWGSFLCFATRTVPSAFHEPRYMGIALHNELITSAAFHVVRFLMVPSLHPDWTLLLFFIHTHVTTTMTLALLFIPKFLHAGTPLREEIAAEVYEDELDMRRSGSYLNSSITSAWSEHSLDPDDIRDELKKLYTQLEVHKTKKMTANNPHLQKKRSSKRGLGRSLMRRITEIPESMSRQCSKEEKDGSVGGGSESRSSSYKRRHLDSGSSSMKLKDDSSSKHKLASSLKKSHSTYDHYDVKENNLPTRHDSCKEAPLLDSLMRKKLAKKASERSNSDSLDDSVPLVYKSASAHNLLADKKPLHPKPSPLQKSLSVVTSAKEKALLLTSRAYLEDCSKLARDEERRTTVEDSTTNSEVSGPTEVTDVASEVVAKQLQTDDASEGTVSSLFEDSAPSKDTMCPWEAVTAPSTPTESRPQKHVTYASTRSVSINTSDLPGKRQHGSKKIPPEPPIRRQSLAHSLERRDVAPGNTQDQMQPPTHSSEKDAKDNPVLVNICPWEAEEPLAKTEMEGTRQAEDSVPLSSSAGLNRLASIAAEVCPWEVMEVPISSKKDSQSSDSESQKSSPEKQPQSPQISPPKSSMKSLGMAIKAFNRSRIKTNIRARKEGEKETGEMIGKPKLAEVASMFMKGPLRQQVTSRSPGEIRAKTVSKQATICPWDEEDELPSPQKASPSKTLEICPWEMSQDDPVQSRASSTAAMAPKSTGELSPVKLERANSQRESVCPWETISADQDKTSSLSLVVSKSDKKAEACPWEVAEVPMTSTARDMSTALQRDESVKEGRGAPSRKLERESSHRDSVCPWENAGAEDSSMKPTAKIPDLPKVVLKTSSSGERKKVEVCPWETETEMCPSEVATSPSEKGTTQVDGAPSKGGILKEHPLKMPEKNIQRDSICPWEGIESEESLVKPSAKSLDPTKARSKKLDSFQSKKAEIAPWETEDVEPDSKMTVCPWENNEAPTPKQVLKKDASVVSKEEKKVTREMTLEKGSDGKRESICPWENTGSEDLISKPKSPDLSKGSSKIPVSTESPKAAVCPWEAEGAEVSAKADICPWEETPAPSDERTSRQDTGRAPKRAGVIMSTSTENVSSPRESICPWETMDTGDLLSGSSVKSPDLSTIGSQKSHSIESFKAEVCPWESQEAEPTTKADVCLWKVTESPQGRRPSSKGDGALESDGIPPIKQTKLSKTESSPLESICPWESVGPSEHSVKTELSKTSSKKSDSAESLKAEVCPWEVTEGPSEESILRKDDRVSPTPMSYSESMARLSSSREDICPWESMELEEPSARASGQSPALSKAGSKKSDSAESLRAEVCPWETAEEEPSSTVEICPWTAAIAPFEKGKLREDPFGISKGKKDEALRSPDSKKSGGEGTFKKIEKSKSHQESVCPWGSLDFDKPPAKSTRSLDLLQVSSKKSDSSESLKAEICPWEFQELQTSDKVEMCPWEVAEGPSKKGALKDKGRISKSEATTTGCLKSMEKASSSRESICPWESMELLSEKSSDLSKAGSKKSDSVESLRAEVFPWEMEEEESSSKIEMPTTKTAPAPINKGILRQDVSGGSKDKTLTRPDKKETGREAASKKIEKTRSHQELTRPQKLVDEASEKLSSKSLDLSKVGFRKSDSVESLKAEVCPWEIQEVESTAKAEVCPWEVAETPPEKRISCKDVDDASKGHMKTFSKSPRETSKTVEKSSSFRESACPWESAETAEVLKTSHPAKTSESFDSTESRKTDICPWEVDLPEESSKEAICPWETEMPTKTEKHASRAGRTEMPTATMKRSQSKQEGVAAHKPLCRTKGSSPLSDTSMKSRGDTSVIDRCPWEAKGQPTSTRKDSVDVSKAFSDVCPWEAEDSSPTSAIPAKSKAGEKPEADDAKGPSKSKSDICPWDCD
ncbi:probable G-protein coupled receptor 179 isoform X2 [Hemicordylus capensis]|uniref:probable G-protein coupled receptor 179 isoform X2 n=1 Tax=Hemicordylus capensis TaxID=884348 RepID=UPI0023036C57|nr:probable G-protein coupled receptor 179 isoform X2 [Hemicordylus capensis]